MNTVKTNQYGDIVKRVIEYADYYCKINYEYNQFNQLIAITRQDKSGCLLSRTKYEYTYDLYGNKVKKHIEMKFNNDIETAEQNRHYYNIYIDNRLRKIIKTDDNQEIYEEINLEYSKELLDMKKVLSYNKINNTFDVHKYYYNNKILYSESVSRDNLGEIYQIKYEMLPDGQYSKKLYGPCKSKYAWRITSVEQGSMYFISTEEPILNKEILTEIINFVMHRTPEKAEIILDIGNSDCTVYCEELQKIENEYTKLTNGHICKVM